MADLTVNTFTGGVVTETLVAVAAGGDMIPNYTGKELIVLRNSHATLSRTITFDSVQACNYGSDHNLAITIPGSATPVNRIIQLPTPVSRWKDTNGKVAITYSDSGADITIGVFKTPNN